MGKKIKCRFCGKESTENHTVDHLAEDHPIGFLIGAVILSPLILAAAILESKPTTISVTVKENNSGFSGPFYDE